MNRLDEYISAVLLNNPSAVAYNMAQLGVLQGDSYDPQLLKQGLIAHLQREGDAAAMTLVAALDVPVDYNGQQANELASYHTVKGNRAVVEALLAEMMLPVSSPTDLTQQQITIPVKSVFQGLLGVLIFTLILFLIRKM